MENMLQNKFETFWAKYPRKIAKPKAFLSYKKYADQHEAIIAGLDKYLVKWESEGTSKEFIPYPTTWLNQCRWEDEIEVFSNTISL